MDRRSVLKALAAAAACPIAPGLVSGCGGPPGPITKLPSWVSLRHPETEDEIVALVREARARRAQIRVRGSMHSVGAAIFTDEDDKNVNLHLDRYNRILCWDESRMQVTVQAGIHLGIDPLDAATSWQNSLNFQLQERGWALPSLGGITHQTVGGFLSTGSAGGSVHHDAGSAVVSMRVVRGDGSVRVLTRDPDDDANPFYAAGVAMGLFGVVSTVTFQCVPTYNVVGRVVTCGVADPKAPAHAYGEGERSLQKWFEDSEDNRALIWPQKGVDKIQFWQAGRMPPGNGFRPQPYEQLHEGLQKVSSFIYKSVDKKPPPYDETTYGAMRQAIKLFIQDEQIEFRDYWYRALPMDNTISDLWMPTEFTELFVDISRTTELMRLLRDYWKADRRMERTGPYTTEVYPSRESKFWMSPSFRRRSMRVDFLWFKSGKTDPAKDFYPQYWELLKPFAFRFHWGKHLSAPESSTGVAYRRAQLGEERYQRWLALRAEFDPDQIFVSDYWRRHLGIPRAV